jgi:hypothetical protein
LIFEDRVAYYLDPYWNVPPTLLFATHQTSPWEPVTIALGQVCYNLILAAQLTCRNDTQVVRHVNFQFCHIDSRTIHPLMGKSCSIVGISLRVKTCLSCVWNRHCSHPLHQSQSPYWLTDCASANPPP